jgi:hypothetical protein
MTKMTAAQRRARNLKVTSSAAFYAGAVGTVSANMYASEHSAIGLIIGAWIPLAFFLSVELLERIPARGRAGKVRLAAIVVIAAVAGWTSYWHLVHVAEAAGVTDPVTKYGLPLTVDALMVVSRMVMNAKAASPARSTRRKAAPSNVRQLKAKTA